MEKHGDITDQTPQCGKPPAAYKPGEPHSKEAADQLEDHPATRASDAVAASVKQSRRG